MITEELIINLLLILVVAWVLGELFSRLGLPFMLGELLAGIILGPPLLGVVTSSPSLDLLADLGIFFVMFYTGMEMDPKELLGHIRPAMAVAIGGFFLPFALGMAAALGFGGTTYQAMVMGLGSAITAIAVQSIILHSLNINQTAIGHILIGAAIIDDVLALVTLSIILGVAKTGVVQFADIAVICLKVAAFFGFTILAGHFVLPRFARGLHDREGKAFTFAMVVALAMAYLAELAGLHLIIGAFLGGQFVREEIMEQKIYNAIRDRFFGLSYGFLVPIFFVSLSFHLHFELSWNFLLFATVITLVAIVGKLGGCGLGFYLCRRNFWEAAIVGFGMNGRGAVELVIASVFLKLSEELMASGAIVEPLITASQFSALILMAFVTTLMAPLSLRWAAARACGSDKKAAFCSMWESNKRP